MASLYRWMKDQNVKCLTTDSSEKASKILQGYQKVFRHIKFAICAQLVHVNKNCIKYKILIVIIPTFSENFIQIDEVWPQLQPKT